MAELLNRRERTVITMDRALRRLVYVALLALTGAIGALLLEGTLSTAPGQPFGHTESGHLVGWLALMSVAGTLAYSWVKRAPRLQRWKRASFRLHMIAGVTAPVLVLVHSGIHLHALVPIVATTAMLAISMSGVIGKTVHFFAVRTLRAERHDLRASGLNPEQVEERIETLAAEAEAFRVWQYVHAPGTIFFLAAIGAHVIGALYFGGP
jgi:hypothetical protein